MAPRKDSKEEKGNSTGTGAESNARENPEQRIMMFPENYKPLLDTFETELAIKEIKDIFQTLLSGELNLRRVTAPMFVKAGTGINDDLNGIEKPVSFKVKDDGSNLEIVQSLAKWKRMMLADLDIPLGEGLYTDMNAIRPDEMLDNLHSLYVDQWDWERHISLQQRNTEFLKDTVRKIYRAMKITEENLCKKFQKIKPILPPEITFIHSEELEERFPKMTPKLREDTIAMEHGAVFIIGIGANLKSGKPHDGRAPDYDDWTTPGENDRKGLNGDIIVWYPPLHRAFELSSMGIRVSPESLKEQLKLAGREERLSLMWHKRLIEGKMPYSIGGGIGQSRLCMFYLRKAHIGEVQVGYWPEGMHEQCRASGVKLL